MFKTQIYLNNLFIFYRIVSTHEGIVNKVSLFDKDMMFLMIFGLRGFKHEREARVGLRCAADLHETFKTWKEIKSVSIGVTSGMTYCGVVGHTLRREYSVISVTVNKAARLMMAYPEMVSCEHQVMLESKLPAKHFKQLPKRVLKGLNDDLTVFEFKEVLKSDDKVDLQFKSPLFGRSEVLTMSHHMIKVAILQHNQEYFYDDDETRTACFLIRGEIEEGKSRVLKEIYSHLRSFNLNCLFMPMSSYNMKIPFHFIQRIVRTALKLNLNENIQKAIEEILIEFEIADFLYLLNPIFGTNFTDFNYEISKDDFTSSLLRILFIQVLSEFHLVLIDDAELMDKESFCLLDCLFNCDSVFTFMTLGRQKKLNERQTEMLNDSMVTQYFLDTLDQKSQTLLACKCLKADALAPEFMKFLHSNSDGVPGWIEAYVEASTSRGGVTVKTLTKEEATIAAVKIEGEPQDSYQVAVFTQVPSQYLVVNGRNDNDLVIYDSLTTYEQLVCKCASVIGVQFTRHMLFYVCSAWCRRNGG